MKVNFYATYRQIVGQKTIDVPVAGAVTVRQLVDATLTLQPRLRAQFIDESGALYRHVHIFINGRAASLLVDGMDTALQPDDTVNIFPPVGGG
jgi:molybdopterin synthase sulfur carrier subunit